MNGWKAKYKALAAGIDDPTLIENAEKLVQAAISIVRSNFVPTMDLEQVVNSLLRTVQVLREKGGP